MVDVPTRTLRSYVNSLPSGGNGGVVDRNLTIRNDLVTATQALPAGGTTGQVLAKDSNSSFDVSWQTAGAGDMTKAVYDPQGIEADAFDRANQTGTQPASTVTGLATVATSGSYADLSDLPPRSTSTATTATLTPDADAYDVVSVTAQAGAITVTNPTGTFKDGQSLTVRLCDDGTSRAITWGTDYDAFEPDNLHAATVTGKTMVFRFMWNAATSKWDLIGGNCMLGLWS